MGCQIAISGFPLHGRFWTSGAVPTRWKLGGTVTTVALLHDLMANPAVVGTPGGGHKRALFTFTNRCTNHRNHPLSWFIKNMVTWPERFSLEQIRCFWTQKKGRGSDHPALYLCKGVKIWRNIIRSAPFVKQKCRILNGILIFSRKIVNLAMISVSRPVCCPYETTGKRWIPQYPG